MSSATSATNGLSLQTPPVLFLPSFHNFSPFLSSKTYFSLSLIHQSLIFSFFFNSIPMSFSAKSQTLPLVSSTQLSSSSSSYFLSPCRIGSLRREFLGSGHNLRPPGLRYRRKWKKLGFHVHSPRLILRASLSSQSMFVLVSVVTVSALTAVYLNYFHRKKEVKEVFIVMFFFLCHWSSL